MITDITDIYRYPNEYFGLPDQRRFPMYTQEEVEGCIRFFDLCEEEYKNTLAKNIGHRLQELGLAESIQFKGKLMRYFDVRKYGTKTGSVQVMEASNVGTLEPIVGATNGGTQVLSKKLPTEEFNSLDDTRKLQTLIANGNIKTVIDDEDKHSLAIDDVAKEYLMRDNLDFSSKMDSVDESTFPTIYPILRESLNQASLQLEATPFMISYEGYYDYPTEYQAYIKMISATPGMSARERADKVIALLYNGGMANIINNILERNIGDGEVVQLVINALRQPADYMEYKTISILLGSAMTDDIKNYIENVSPSLQTNGFPEILINFIQRLAVPVGLPYAIYEYTYKAINTDHPANALLSAHLALMSSEPSDIEYCIERDTDGLDNQFWLYNTRSGLCYYTRSYVDLSAQCIFIVMYPLISVFDGRVEITDEYREVSGLNPESDQDRNILLDQIPKHIRYEKLISVQNINPDIKKSTIVADTDFTGYLPSMVQQLDEFIQGIKMSSAHMGIQFNPCSYFDNPVLYISDYVKIGIENDNTTMLKDAVTLGMCIITNKLAERKEDLNLPHYKELIEVVRSTLFHIQKVDQTFLFSDYLFKNRWDRKLFIVSNTDKLRDYLAQAYKYVFNL